MAVLQPSVWPTERAAKVGGGNSALSPGLRARLAPVAGGKDQTDLCVYIQALPGDAATTSACFDRTRIAALATRSNSVRIDDMAIEVPANHSHLFSQKTGARIEV